MAATIRDVARQAGVGTGTVSRVINNHKSVDPATRARVLQAIPELEFRPSLLGRRLSASPTRTVLTPTATSVSLPHERVGTGPANLVRAATMSPRWAPNRSRRRGSCAER